MRKGILILSAFFLAGCPGPGDRFIEQKTASVRLQANHVCVVSPLNQNEKLLSFRVFSEDDKPVMHFFNDGGLYVQKGDCLPILNYSFKKDVRYAVSYNVTNEKTANHFILLSNFKITSDARGKDAITFLGK
ncbi:hypothetical protein HA48_11715 [Pantoea wallisii]|uniref:DUF7480 domain-containing protein n=1 Tax=Pantoea wallisii TaxID=1076551 RepID=A0A1X1D8Q8_9GAMM|nr:putative T6SS immunity periplasmic lipoprotein [Pantoea wallisii]ORM73038.1 hypothetical protein HA48_11715 [Pantoea wallisii]